MDAQRTSMATIAALVLLGAFTSAALFLAPLLVGELVTTGYSEQEAGLIISAEWIGMFFACLPALWWVKKHDIRRVLLWALGIMALGNVLSAFAEPVPLLLLARALASLGAGTGMCVCLVGILQQRNPDRVFGLWVAAQLALAILGMGALPPLFTRLGISAFYLILVAFTLVFPLLLRFLPRTVETGAGVGGGAGVASAAPARRQRAFFALGALLVYYVGIYCVWPYLERMGAHEGLRKSFIDEVLAWSFLLGLAGALSASWIGDRISRFAAIALSILLSVACSVALGLPTTPAGYAIGICALSYAWNFVIPYLMANVAVEDSSGSFIILACAASAAGLSIGPAISAYLLADQAYERLVPAAIGFFLLCLYLAYRAAPAHPDSASLVNKDQNIS